MDSKEFQPYLILAVPSRAQSGPKNRSDSFFRLGAATPAIPSVLARRPLSKSCGKNSRTRR